MSMQGVVSTLFVNVTIFDELLSRIDAKCSEIINIGTGNHTVRISSELTKLLSLHQLMTSEYFTTGGKQSRFSDEK